MLLVEARDWGRFLLLTDVVVSDRERDLDGIFPAVCWSIISMIGIFGSGWALLLFFATA